MMRSDNYEGIRLTSIVFACVDTMSNEFKYEDGFISYCSEDKDKKK